MVKPRLVLHIGTEKTGTTTIQHFLRLNRRLLSQHSILIPAFLGQANHFAFPFLAYAPGRMDDVVCRAAPGLSGEDLAPRRAELLEKLAKKAEGSGFQCWIISSEHLSSRLMEDNEIFCLRKIVDEYFSAVKVIVYLRDPLSVYISSWSTALKCGSVEASLSEPGAGYADRLADHRSLLQRWSRFFDKNELDVRLYERRRLLNGSVIEDFCQSAGIDCVGGCAIPEGRNASLSWAAMQCLARFNQIVLESDGHAESPVRRGVVKYFAAAFEGFPAYVPPAGSVQKWDLHYADSIAYIRREFFPDLTGRLWESVSELPPGEAGVRAVGDVEDALIQTAASIFVNQQSQILRLEERLKSLSVDR